jgi:outer membrane protein assembly factor BamB
VWGRTVFLTTAVSTNPEMVFEAKLKGERDDRQDKAVQEFRVVAVDGKTGKILWNSLAVRTAPRVLRHPHNSYASPTAATDGKHLVVSFGSEGVFCFNFAGKMIWKKDLGIWDQGAFDVPDYQWGTAASPVIWKGKVRPWMWERGGRFGGWDGM